ncbi:P-loop containing nucleoside triphosphate hydrolase protein [Fusarium venenatum]|uniref:P-loop containing nucleoside triphosphate hydrolase protein n=1 Tax=Fusarium venenatum TaxID=56646 RepID=UPI001D2134FB|nr:P-loop containing nucleoside triphosphate hydrolase protein [Fusarium venenatum]
MDVSVSSETLKGLHTKEATSLHNLSDKLSACGVGQIVDLPQIIVVGEQSAGKSSVLEAISHIRFPVDSGVCTRFATELIFRLATETRINASVRFADKDQPSQTFQRKKFHEDDLPDIIKEAKEHMGFSRDGKDFSRDVLRLEIEGPNIYPLSLVDLPGLYHTSSHNQSLGGKDSVNHIILVVVAANVNLVSHSALQKAKDIDPQRQRTIGVITKPDLALASHAKEYIMLAKNQESAHKLQLGWHDRGIATFRKKLSGILYQHIRKSLPGVIEDIETKLRARQGELTRLGTPRDNVKAMRSYLLTIASEFQRLARDGCNGRYNDAFFCGLDDEDMKFRALLRNFNRAFDHILRIKGSTQIVVSSKDETAEEDKVPEHLARFLDRYHQEFQDPERITVEELSVKLENKAAANQGREFPGSPNTDLAMQLFKNQAGPWKAITEFHVDTVVTVAKAFVDQLFKHVIGSSQNNPTTEAILAILVDPFFEKKEKLLRDKIDELLWPYLQGYSLPVDIEFYGALSQKSTDPRQFGTDKIIDMMLTYYEMSRRTFTDNVINLAIESCLVHSIPEILTPTEVDGMDDVRLKELAAERSETTSRRALLNADIELLKKGLDTCRRYKPRPATVTTPSVAPNPPVAKPADPIPTTAQAKLAPERPSESSTIVTNGSIAGQPPSLAIKGPATGSGSMPNTGTTATNSGPNNNGTSSVQGVVPTISNTPNTSTVSMPSRPGGGLFGGTSANVTPQQKPLAGNGTGSFGGFVQQKPSASVFGGFGGGSGSLTSNATKG